MNATFKNSSEGIKCEEIVKVLERLARFWKNQYGSSKSMD